MAGIDTGKANRIRKLLVPWKLFLTLSLAPGADSDLKHINNDEDICAEHGDALPIRALHDFEDFPGQIHGAGEQRKPLGPDAAVPESPGFDKSHNGVGGRGKRNGQQARVGNFDCRVHKHLGEATIRIDVKIEEQVRCEILSAVMKQKQRDSEQHDNEAFESFESGDGAKTGGTGAFIDTGDVCGVMLVSAHFGRSVMNGIGIRLRRAH